MKRIQGSSEGDALLIITLMGDCMESPDMCLSLSLFLQLCTCAAFDCEDTKEAGMKYEWGGAGRGRGGAHWTGKRRKGREWTGGPGTLCLLFCNQLPGHYLVQYLSLPGQVTITAARRNQVWHVITRTEPQGSDAAARVLMRCLSWWPREEDGRMRWGEGYKVRSCLL